MADILCDLHGSRLRTSVTAVHDGRLRTFPVGKLWLILTAARLPTGTGPPPTRCPSPRSSAAHSRDGRRQPCNRSRLGNEVLPVTGRAQGGHPAGSARSGVDGGRPGFDHAAIAGTACHPAAANGEHSSCSVCALPCSARVADGVRRGRAKRSGPARPRASSARATARQGGLKPYRKSSQQTSAAEGAV